MSIFLCVFWNFSLSTVEGNSSSIPSVFEANISPGTMRLEVLQGTLSRLVPENTVIQSVSWDMAVKVTDTRGSGAGWSVSMKMQHLTTVTEPLPGALNTSPLIRLSPRYRYGGWFGENPCSVVVVVSNPGPVEMARVTTTLSGGSYCIDGNFTSGASFLTQKQNTSLGNGRLLIDFPEGNYILGDSYSLQFDMIDYRRCHIDPADPSASKFSSLTGLRKSSLKTFNGTSTESFPIVVLSAEVGRGMGAYEQRIPLTCEIHPNALRGVYTSAVTFSVL